mmetsp:Transcript_28775/g.95618  ORF Transcript_28775/g.95618 Transcript_28775/m.95618 type:complete len:202 (-) Transcript_28775:1041-1646(-)
MKLGHGLQRADGQREAVQPSGVLPHELLLLVQSLHPPEEADPRGRSPIASIACGILRLPRALASTEPCLATDARSEVHDGALQLARVGGGELPGGRGGVGRREDEEVTGVDISVKRDLPIQPLERRAQLCQHGACRERGGQEGPAVQVHLVACPAERGLRRGARRGRGPALGAQLEPIDQRDALAPLHRYSAQEAFRRRRT